MGPKIVSQMIKEEEATHSKGQADSLATKNKSTLHKEIGRKKVFWLVGLACQHWPPLAASCGPLVSPPRKVCGERLFSLLLFNLQAAFLPSS